MEKKLGMIGSSVDGSKVGATVTGLIMGFSTLIIWGAGRAGIPLVESQLGDIAVQLGAVATLLVTVFGAIRKLVVYLAGLRATTE